MAQHNVHVGAKFKKIIYNYSHKIVQVAGVDRVTVLNSYWKDYFGSRQDLNLGPSDFIRYPNIISHILLPNESS